MGHFEPQMTDKLLWLRVESAAEGIHYLPASEFTREEIAFDYDNADDLDFEELWGYGVRASAPGYLDCTEWSVYRNKREATKAYNQLARELRAEEAA